MLQFFDCDVGFGASGFTYPAVTAVPDLLAMMDRYGVSDAFVYDRHAHEAGVFDRFDDILAVGRASPHLHPTIAVLPPACGEQPPPAELVRFILANGIGAVRACPKAHNFIFDVVSMGPLLELLEAHRIPVLFTSQGMQDHEWLHEPPWRDLRDVAKTFPALPIVMTYGGMLQGRRVLPLLAACPNLMTDMSCMSFHYIEYVVAQFGAERLVVASHFPTEDPGLYTTGVSYAGLPPAVRQQLAGGNARRLLEGIRP